MRHTTKKFVPGHTEDIFSHITCDSCNVIIEEKGFDICDITIEHKEGTVYPEGGSLEVLAPDICTKCFNKKIIPVLKEMGINTEYTTVYV